jgi:hypothetical protein
VAANTVWKSGLLLAFGALCGAGQTFPGKLQITVYDGAGLGPKILSSAEKLTEKILLASGLEAQWSAGPLSELKRLRMDFTAPRAGECASSPALGLQRVQILRRAPAGFSPPALGFSLPCATTGFQVTLYADRIAAVSEKAAPTFGRVLGYALAHELGHVLTHSTAHENNGLMKGVWSKTDWQRAAVELILFSPEQARRIRQPLILAASKLSPER